MYNEINGLVITKFDFKFVSAHSSCFSAAILDFGGHFDFFLLYFCCMLIKISVSCFLLFKRQLFQHFAMYMLDSLYKPLILSAILDFGGHLELPKDANLASSGFQIRIPIPTYFCKNIFYRRYCTVILGTCRTKGLGAHSVIVVPLFFKFLIKCTDNGYLVCATPPTV